MGFSHVKSWRGPVLFLVGMMILQRYLATNLGLLASEAYYRWLSQEGFEISILSLVLQFCSRFGESESILRIGSGIAYFFGVASLWSLAHDRWIYSLGWAMPGLFLFGIILSPSSLLIMCWAIALRAAITGGYGWMVAGGVAGIASLIETWAGSLFVLCFFAAEPAERRSKPMMIGACLGGVMIWVGAVNKAATAIEKYPVDSLISSPIMVLMAGGPFLLLAMIRELGPLRKPQEKWNSERIRRFAWWVSVPVWIGFLTGSLLGTMETESLAPAWIGMILLFSQDDSSLWRLRWLGTSTAAIGSILIAIHLMFPLVQLPFDPFREFRAGRALKQLVAPWIYPVGVNLDGYAPPNVGGIWTERYQEAAWIRYYLHVPAKAMTHCNEIDRFDASFSAGWFLRSAQDGGIPCIDRVYPNHTSGFLLDAPGVGRWELYELRERP